MKRINQVIIETSFKYIGVKEIKGNAGWANKNFQSLMQRMGWKKYQAYCAYFAEAVWREAYASFDRDMEEVVERLFSASAVKTFKKFKEAGWQISHQPEMGALAVWQKYKNGKKTWMGHIGVVVDYTDNNVTTIDGNTNNRKTREGGVVAKVTRGKNFNVFDGLVLLGFVYPDQIFKKKEPTEFKPL